MRPNPARRITVFVNNRPFVVELADAAQSPYTVWVNGRRYVVSVEDGAAEVVPAGTAPAEAEVPAREAPASSGRNPAGRLFDVVRAPMPGNILEVAVKAGDRVTYGQALCALEAMKMKSAIKSPRAGIIAEVRVKSGQAVGHGEVLFTFV